MQKNHSISHYANNFYERHATDKHINASYTHTKGKRLIMQPNIKLLERNHEHHFILIRACKNIHL
jgi:hypothetical protein